METTAITETVRQIVGAHGRLAVDIASVGDDQDLYRAGMTSHANVNVMLSLEDAFEVEFPEEMLTRSTFESISAITKSVSSLLETPN